MRKNKLLSLKQCLQNYAGKFPGTVELEGTNIADVKLELTDVNGGKQKHFTVSSI